MGAFGILAPKLVWCALFSPTVAMGERRQLYRAIALLLVIPAKAGIQERKCSVACVFWIPCRAQDDVLVVRNAQAISLLDSLLRRRLESGVI